MKNSLENFNKFFKIHYSGDLLSVVYNVKGGDQ